MLTSIRGFKKMYLKEIGRESADQMYLTWDRDQ
jgi:hypothetical protein